MARALVRSAGAARAVAPDDVLAAPVGVVVDELDLPTSLARRLHRLIGQPVARPSVADQTARHAHEVHALSVRAYADPRHRLPAAVAQTKDQAVAARRPYSTVATYTGPGYKVRCTLALAFAGEDYVSTEVLSVDGRTEVGLASARTGSQVRKAVAAHAASVRAQLEL